MSTPMTPADFDEAIRKIRARDPRYAEDAYHFVREALDVTVKAFRKPRSGTARHVTGQELLEGIRAHALAEFGPMTARVLATWNLHRTEDFGAVVFHLVDAGVLGRTEEDRPEDFAHGYDFDTAFRAPFRPRRRRAPARPTAHPTERRSREP
jgi:uncharacterized repeat protein (TIGR04138 family)